MLLAPLRLRAGLLTSSGPDDVCTVLEDIIIRPWLLPGRVWQCLKRTLRADAAAELRVEPYFPADLQRRPGDHHRRVLLLYAQKLGDTIYPLFLHLSLPYPISQSAIMASVIFGKAILIVKPYTSILTTLISGSYANRHHVLT